MVTKVAQTVGFSNAELNAIGTDFYSAMASGSTTVPAPPSWANLLLLLQSDNLHIKSSDTADAALIST